MAAVAGAHARLVVTLGRNGAEEWSDGGVTKVVGAGVCSTSQRITKAHRVLCGGRGGGVASVAALCVCVCPARQCARVGPSSACGLC